MKPKELVAKWLADNPVLPDDSRKWPDDKWWMRSRRHDLATYHEDTVLDIVEQAYAEGQRDTLEAAAKLRDGAGKEVA